MRIITFAKKPKGERRIKLRYVAGAAAIAGLNARKGARNVIPRALMPIRIAAGDYQGAKAALKTGAAGLVASAYAGRKKPKKTEQLKAATSKKRFGIF